MLTSIPDTFHINVVCQVPDLLLGVDSVIIPITVSAPVLTPAHEADSRSMHDPSIVVLLRVSLALLNAITIIQQDRQSTYHNVQSPPFGHSSLDEVLDVLL